MPGILSRYPLPTVVQDWPAPPGRKQRPARWLNTAESFRSLMEAAEAQSGAEALAVIWNDSPRHSGSRLTRWFAPGVPMHAAGVSEDVDGKTWHAFYIPARAALTAFEAGDVKIKKSAGEN